MVGIVNAVQQEDEYDKDLGPRCVRVWTETVYRGVYTGPCDLVVAPSGPRGSEDNCHPARNANLGRIARAMQKANACNVPLLISGHSKEVDRLRSEAESVRLKLGLSPLEQRHIRGHARNTCGNVADVLSFAFVWFGGMKEKGLRSVDCELKPLTIVIYTHSWHAPRLQHLIWQQQVLLCKYSKHWWGRQPFRIEVVGIDSDDLDPDFYVPIAGAQTWGPDAPDWLRIKSWSEEFEAARIPHDLPKAIAPFFKEADLRQALSVPMEKRVMSSELEDQKYVRSVLEAMTPGLALVVRGG